MNKNFREMGPPYSLHETDNLNAEFIRTIRHSDFPGADLLAFVEQVLEKISISI